MKDIEINSDKFTVIFNCFILVLVLLIFFSNLFGVLKHRPAPPSNLGLGDYVGTFLITCLAVLGCRDRQLRRKYPYGIAGACGMAIGSFVPIAMDWTKASVETQNLAGTLLMVLTVVASGLVLVEGMRWFKKKVRLSANV